MSEPMPEEKNSDLAANGKLKRKEYERELARLHVEFVKQQQWVVDKGLKVCILFEGRDGAGKGGMIKAMTERVSPRIFRVVALPAPTEREKSQMYAQRYIPHLPAAGEVVICDRYYASSIVYQAAMDPLAGPELMKWIAEVNAHARRPDKTVVLDLDPEIAASRRATRGTPGELFEQRNIDQRFAVTGYAGIPVPVPRATEVRAFLDDLKARNAGASQLHRGQQSGDAAAHDQDVD